MTATLAQQTVIHPDDLAAWRIDMHENGYSRSSIRTYLSAGRALMAYNQTDPEANWINRYFNSQRAVFSAATLQVHRAAARHLFKFLALDTPLEDYRMPPVVTREAHPLPNGMADVYTLLAVTEKASQRFLTIAFCGLAGMRISEALSCKPSDFDFGKKRIRIMGKGEKIRYIPLSLKMMELVLPHIIDRFAPDAPDTPFITLAETSARQGVVAAGAFAHLARPIASHDLRMTFATFIYDQHKDIRLVQELLGHSSIETTQLYVGLDPAKTRAAVDTAFASK